MGSDEVETNDERTHDTQSICLHAFSDLSHISPPMFVALLKACYVRGTEKATKKFQVLQQQVHLVLQNSPQPGPATFVLQCLYVFPVLGPLYTEGFSHLIISSLRRLLKTIPAESEAKKLAAKIFLDVTSGLVNHEERIFIKLLEVVDVKLENIAEAMCDPEVYDGNLDKAKAYVGPYIFKLVESQSFMLAVTLLERFSIRQSGEEFLMRMIEENQFKAAEKWATYMGKPLLVILINKYLDLKLLKNAYELIKKNDLKQDFPEVHLMYKESQLKKFAEKGLWDIAESRVNNNRQLLEYLVYLAMEAGYSEKVDELCERYALDGFAKSQEPQAKPTVTRFLHLKELIVEDIKWVDEADGLLSATSYTEECKVIGVDCEWKPNYVKGSKPNKVSIMQIASEKTVFILDLIKLSKDEPALLDNCLKRILHSSSILKLGYNLQCDLKQLSQSYGELECFKHFEMLLDIQNVFKEPRGGLSGLAKSYGVSLSKKDVEEKIMGASLNKTRRNSNWEQRPLTQQQMEYAALDAVVLIHIFYHIRNQPQAASANSGQPKMEWKSNIVSHIVDTKKSKAKKTPKPKSTKEVRPMTNALSN
ncbi:hypothetical protein C5167_030705 [Papaver somniferum]|nr:hypothetical protein C5167_030705 [Papaver somniferum]